MLHWDSTLVEDIMALQYYRLIDDNGKCYGSGVTDGGLPAGAVACSAPEANRPLGWIDPVTPTMTVVVTNGGKSAGLSGGLSGKPEYDLDGTYDITTARLAEWTLYRGPSGQQYTQGYWPITDASGALHLWPGYEFGLFLGFVSQYIQAMIMYRAGKTDGIPSNVLDIGAAANASGTSVDIQPPYHAGHAGGRH